MSVKNTHKDYDTMAPKWKRCRDVIAGRDALMKQCYEHSTKHDQTSMNDDAYIPALKNQTPSDYRSYITRTPFYNATWRTIAGLKGMLFRKEPVTDVPPAVEVMLDDVTQDGVSLEVFAQTLSEECISVGRVGVMVDYPPTPTKEDGSVFTLADAIQLNLRPTMSMYRAEAILNWRTTRVNNAQILTMVVLEECEETIDPEDEFEIKEETRYRVLDLVDGLYRQRLFAVRREGDKEVDVLLDEFYPLMGNKPLTYIPFKFLSSDDVTPEVDLPPLLDLVDMNLSHYRVSADYEHGCHFAGLPTAYIAGYKKEDGEELYIGSATAWVFPDPSAKAGFLEFTGQGLTPLKENMADKEQRMAVLGARMLEGLKKGVESAQTASIHRVGEESLLAAIATSISQGLTAAVVWFCEWAGSADIEAKIDINKDFYPVPMGATTLTALVSAWQMGAISKETLFENLKQGQIIDDDDEFEEEEQKIQDGYIGAPAASGGIVEDTGTPQSLDNSGGSADA